MRSSTNSTNSQIFSKSFEFEGVYPCPICHIGKISSMPMMETMGCDFCHEIFTVDLEQQQIKMPSRQPPLVWRWNGWLWTETHIEGVELGWGYVFLAIIFVLLPSSLIGIVAYYFPPHAEAWITWLPYIWTILTFLSHLLIVVWIMVEIYQIPIQAYLRAINRWKNRLVGK